ncbi:MAG TPA: EAL domain-containing protein, partial [Chromatiales bacterium]|nr:EAL domain-containing protein [Chromatiales bacterium]
MHCQGLQRPENQHPMNRPASSLDQPASAHAQAEQLLQFQRDILEAIALGQDPQLALDSLCRAAEALVPGSVASIMVYHPLENELEVRSAPSVPEKAISTINHLRPGPAAGSCGTTIFRNEPQFVSNTLTDQRWGGLQEFAKEFNIHACWSMPIRLSDSQPIGTFALSSFAERPPDDFQIRLLETSAQIAGIVLRREQAEEQLWHVAHHDSLTGLPNRMLLNLRAEHAIEQARRKYSRLALLFLDLDHFKTVNDSLGHHAGDELLIQATGRILSCIREGDTLSRLGGDEFVVMLENFTDSLSARHVADKILEAFSQPFRLQQHEYLVTTSIGISIYPEDGDNIVTLVQNADTAMYQAKDLGRNNYHYYEPRLTEHVQARVAMESDLRAALEQDQFHIHYQPQYDIHGRQIRVVEALVRWEHPERGNIPPDDFIPVAEETGLINDIGCRVVEMACRQCLQWWAEGLPPFVLAINLSPCQLLRGCSTKLKNLLDETGFPVDRLEMEVTESMILERGTQAIVELDKMKQMGIRIVLDDFGTGHSSLAQIKTLPISKLKIDKSFVMDIPGDANDTIITRAIIAMGHHLGLEVVAEGV